MNTLVSRVPLHRELTDSERAVSLLLARGFKPDQIATRVGTSVHTVRMHIIGAALKIPGDLPAQTKLIVWWRGATHDVLTGDHLAREDEAIMGNLRGR